MRSTFIKTLIECAKKDPNIYLLNGDLGFSVLEPFGELFPDRYINMGVAEANMVGVAAGLATTGKKVFIYSIIPFVTSRVFEQLRNDVAMQKLHVVVVGVGSGLSYGSMGATHHAIEDIALMRVIPNMTVVAPGDPHEATMATRALAKQAGPAYLRLNKKGDAYVHARIPTFTLGSACWLARGSDVAIIATGNIVPLAQKVEARLAEQDISCSLLSMHTLKPLDVESIKKVTKTAKIIVALEEHSVIGGLGSAVSEVVAQLPPNTHRPTVLSIGIPDTFTHLAGDHTFLREKYSLTEKDIVKRIKKMYVKSG